MHHIETLLKKFQTESNVSWNGSLKTGSIV